MTASEDHAPRGGFGSRTLLGVALSALLYTLAFPTWSIRWLAPVALAPLFFVLRDLSPRAAGFAGALWGLLTAWGVTYWLPLTIADYYHQPIWLGLLLFTGATLVMVSAEYAAACAIFVRLAPGAGALRPILAGALWVLAEFCRDSLLTGNPWAFLGYAVVPLEAGGASPLAILARWGGVFAVTFVLASAAAGVACLLRADRPAREAAVGLVPILGALMLASFVPASAPSATFSRGVCVVQGAVDRDSVWRESDRGKNLETYLELTRDGVRRYRAGGGEGQRPVDLVVWPETAVAFFMEDEPYLQASIATTTAELGVQLLTGGPHVSRGESGERFFNSAYLLAERGGIDGRYDKEHLLPFAEYFPFRSVAFLERSFGAVRQFSPGEKNEPIGSNAGRLGVVICNEAMFGRFAEYRSAAGANVLVNLANDSWVQSPMFGWHQLQLAVTRAVETGRPLIRASTAGPSAIVDGSGRIAAVAGVGEPEVVCGSIDVPADDLAPARGAAGGRALALVCGILVAILALVSGRRGRS